MKGRVEKDVSGVWMAAEWLWSSLVQMEMNNSVGQVVSDCVYLLYYVKYFDVAYPCNIQCKCMTT